MAQVAGLESHRMEITFALQPDDIWACNKFIISRVTAFRLRVGVRLVTVPLCLALLYVLVHIQWWVCCLVGFGTACVWLPFCGWSARRYQLKEAQKIRGFLGKQTLEISGEGVRQITPYVNSLIQWANFTEIVESARHIFFFLDRNHALIIPRSAFTSSEEAKVFVEGAQRYRAGLEVTDIASQSGIWPPAPRPGA